MAAVLLAGLAHAPAVRGAPGAIDGSFGSAGAATAHVRTFGTEVAAVAWQGDMLLVAGTSRRNDGLGQGPVELRIVLRRFLPDGTRDLSFGTNGDVVLGVVPKATGTFGGMPRGPRHVRIATRSDATGGYPIVVYADYEDQGDALFYWGIDFDGHTVDYAPFLPYYPPSPVSSLLYDHTVGAVAVTSAGDVVIAGTVRYEGTQRIYVRKLPNGTPGASGDPQFLVTAIESPSVTGLALDEGGNRYYVSATPYDPVAGYDKGSVVVAVAADLSGLATGFNVTGVKSFGGDESAGIVVVPGTPAKVRVATVDRTTAYYRLTQANDDGTVDTAFGASGTVEHGMTGIFARAIGLVRPNTGTVLAVIQGDASNVMQLGYWRTSDAGVDLGLTLPAFPNGTYGAASAIAAVDTKVAVSGYVADAADNRFNAITAFDDQGVLDTAFGGGLVLAPGSPNAPLSAQAMVRQSGGRLVAGTISCNSAPRPPLLPASPPCSIVLQGYTAAGAVDTAFGPGGTGTVVHTLGIDDGDPRLWLALGPSDQVVAAYQGYDAAGMRDQPVVVRFDANGNLLVADRANGATRPDMDVLQGLAVDSAGRALVLFNRFTSSSSRRLAVMRRLAAGGADGAFGTGGVFLSPGLPSGDDEGFGIATDASNRVVVAGWRPGPNLPLLVRLTAGGQLDSAFNGSGYQGAVPGYANGLLHAPAVSGAGTIYVAGAGLPPRLTNFVAAYDGNGQADGGFAGCGVADLGYYAGRAGKVTLDAPDYLLVSGFANTVRFGLAGAPDLQFFEVGGPWAYVQNPGLTYPTTTGTTATYVEMRAAFDAAVVPGGYVLAHPYFRQNTYAGMAIAKYEGGGGARATVGLSGPTSATVGVPATYTATVSAGSGVIRFRFGCPSEGETAVLSAGTATASVTFSTPGTYTVSAVHEGVYTRAPAIAPPLVVTVTAGGVATTTTLVSASNPSVFGQSVHLTATVTGGTPTGTVTFRDGAVVIGSATVSAGVATLDIATLSVGTHSLTAAYGGDGSHASSTSPALTQTVNRAPTSTALTAVPAASRSGESVTLTATVAAVNPGAGPVTGSVRFLDGATLLGDVSLDAGGQATLVVSSLAVGIHPITADYQGTAAHLASSGNASVNVQKADAAATLVAPASPVYGQQATLSSTVSAVAPGSGVPQGTVQFGDGSAIGAAVGLDAVGSASIAWTPLAAGPVTLSATYSGDSRFNATTKTQVITVARGATSATVSTLPATVVAGSPATLRVQIVKVGTGAAPTGSVLFTVDGVPVGGAALDGTGMASLPYTTAIDGPRTLGWTYSGDAHYAASSGTHPFTVLAPGALVFTIVDGNNQRVPPGTQFPLPLRVKIATTAGAPVKGYGVTFVAAAHPLSGATAVLTPLVAFTDDNGIASTIATAAGGAGAYRVTAVSSAGNVDFDLLNWETTTTTANGTTVTLVGAPPPVTLVQANNVAPPLPLPANVTSFPYGLVGFTVEGLAPGATIQVNLTLPGNVNGMAYYKYRNGGYFPMPGASISGNTVVLTLVDGGVGDADGVADGRIVDPGGPAIVAAIGVPVTPVPTLSEGALVLLAAMLGVATLAARRRATLPPRKGPH